MLQQADAITAFLAKQRRRTAAVSTKTAWAVTWGQLAAEGCGCLSCCVKV
jgi:hypothetical protein